MFQRNMYALHKSGCFPIKPEQASAANERQADIYWTPNNFSGFGKRTKESLTEITSFFCEIDEGEKTEQVNRIVNNPQPSLVIETKRGFHIYWHLKEPLDCKDDPVNKADWYRDFVVNRIVPALGADPQAADACRLMRLPFYKYWKDGLGKFMIRIAYESHATYSVKELEKLFPKFKSPSESTLPTFVYKPSQIKFGDEDFWTKANRLDPVAALTRLSGTPFVNGEHFKFIIKNNQTRLLVNGKPANVWIDNENKIGSTDRGGPAIPNWLYWYHQDWRKVAEILREVFNL